MRMLNIFRLPFAAAIVVALGAAVGGYWVWVVLALVVAALVFAFGRDPEREVASHPLGIVSPVDGRVSSVEEGRDPFLDRDALIARVRQDMLSPAVLRSPTEGRVVNIWGGPSIPGHDQGYRLAVHLHTDEGEDVIFTVGRWHLVPGPLEWTVQPGERVGQGQRRGMAGWGRVVSVYLPTSSKAAVDSGTRVLAGRDLVCQLVHGT